MTNATRSNASPAKATSKMKAPTTPAATGRAPSRTKAPPAVPPATPTTVKKTAVRKPFMNRNNSDNADGYSVSPSKSTRNGGTAKTAKAFNVQGGDREPIMAFLRIRPNLTSTDSPPYLEPLSDTSVRMTDPSTNQSTARYRPSAVSTSSLYTFSHIFPPSTTQSEFFGRTTLPLVGDVLAGQNALLFAYGVTNSGKTYSVQGGGQRGSAGILPRSLDVLFNSIDGLQSDGRYRPVRLHGVEPASAEDIKPPTEPADPALAQIYSEAHDNLVPPTDTDIDPTVLKVDRNYEYSVWVSYAEVYNEKVYDLLDNVTPMAPNAALVLKRKALAVRPSPASDSETAGKYIAGLRHCRVTSAAQAKELVRLGQVHRRVFGTLANSASSRSHGLVTIKVLRCHRGERDDPTAIQVSRLTLVDLAGSERLKHTHTTGDRLREAGNINKSLMVLGQCMEVMRANQRQVAQALAGGGKESSLRVDTRDVKKTLAVVPFRHSRLTEVLMDYFIGDGRAVMIVNVNPYDTGYDENSHVMKFAALAREVYTTPALAPVQRFPSPTKASAAKTTTKKSPLKTLRGSDIAPVRRQVTIASSTGAGRKQSETRLEVEEEEEDGHTEGDDDGEADDYLVDALFEEVEELRLKLYDAHMKCALVEMETREQVMEEMEERMRSMERMYHRRLMVENERQEKKMDAKIDMMHQAGLFGSPVKGRTNVQETNAMDVDEPPYDDDEEEENSVRISLIDDADDAREGSQEAFDLEISASESDDSRSPSPLAGKGHRGEISTPVREIRVPVPDGPEHKPLPAGYDDDDEPEAEDMTDTEGDGTSVQSEETDDTQELEESEDYDDYSQDDEEDDEYEPWESPSPREKGRMAKPTVTPRPTLLPSVSPEPISATPNPKGKKFNAAPMSSASASLSPSASPEPIAPPTIKPAAKGRGKKNATAPPTLTGDDIRPNPRATRASTRSTANRASNRSAASHLEGAMREMSLAPNEDGDDSVVIVPDKKARKAAVKNGGPEVEYVPRKSEVSGARKKKRQVGKIAVVTAADVEEEFAKTRSGRNVRRAGKGKA